MEDIKSESSGNKMNMAQLNAVNKIKYALPTNLNVVERRQNKVNFSDQNSYSSTSGSEVVIRLQASTDYVYGKNSYLVMNVLSVKGGTGAEQAIGFKNNTALSSIRYRVKNDRDREKTKETKEVKKQTQIFAWPISDMVLPAVCRDKAKPREETGRIV